MQRRRKKGPGFGNPSSAVSIVHSPPSFARLTRPIPSCRIFKGIANEFAVGNFTATTFGCVLGEDKRVNRLQKKREVEEGVQEEEDNRGG